MKRIFTFFTIALLALAACEPNDELGKTNGTGNENTGGENTGGEDNGNVHEGEKMPIIKITSKRNTTIGPGNVVGRITYELINPVEGMTVEATSNVEWLGEFDYKNMGQIGYKAEKNQGENAREGIITISYGDSSADVTITQEGNPVPTDIIVEAPILTGHYYGNVQGLYNFYLAFSDKGMSSYEPTLGHSYFNVPNAWYYIVDLYLDQPAANEEGEPITVPNGTYDFDLQSQGWPNMFGHEFSWLKQNDENGMNISQIQYDDGELIVEDGKVTLTVTMTVSSIVEKHTVIYEGDYELIDMSKLSYM